MSKSKEIGVLGFALFAIFFGAGNLIFPPLLGVSTGADWLIPSIGFLFTSVGLPLLGVIAFSKSGGDIQHFSSKVSPTFNLIYCSTLIMVIGPLFAIPRTGATTFSLAVIPIMGGESVMAAVMSSIVFFVLTYLLAVKKSKVTDIIGQFLTPIIIITLGIIFTRGLMSSIGDPAASKVTTNLFAYGFTQGYQTMDALGSFLFAVVIVNALQSKGFTDPKEQEKALLGAGLIASVGLGTIYLFLIYFGSLISGAGLESTASPALYIAEATLGSLGRTIFGICVGVACLTTSVGLVSLTADWFAKLTKLSYEVLVLITSVFSAIVAVFGLDFLVQMAVPVLLLLYPVTIVLILMNLLKMKAVYFKLGTYTTLAIALMESLGSTFNVGAFKTLVTMIPLGSAGFVWVVPFILSLACAFAIDKLSPKAA